MLLLHRSLPRDLLHIRSEHGPLRHDAAFFLGRGDLLGRRTTEGTHSAFFLHFIGCLFYPTHTCLLKQQRRPEPITGLWAPSARLVPLLLNISRLYPRSKTFPPTNPQRL